MNTRNWVCWCVMMAMLLTGVPVIAAEFSPVMDDALKLAKDTEFVSAIIILESPVDIRALDWRLHDERADLARRHKEVIDALKYNAEMTQPQFAAELDEAKAVGRVVDYTAYWIENLFVVQATKEFVEGLRDRGDVRYVTENFDAELIEPIRSGDESGEDYRRNHDRNPLDNLFVPPGIRAVGAYRVNTELGITGNGVLVANCDTGVDGSHPALASRWRGLSHPWQECWRDALGGGTTFPVDNNDHGTHVMGTITGRAIVGSDTQWVGCAPNAQWIADNAIDQGVSVNFDNDIIDAYQWFAEPDGNVNTTDDIPDVIQNSWGVFTGLGYAQCFNFWNTVILNCEAAGPVITWSAGNEGTSGLRSPAIYSLNAYQIFSVAAVDASSYPSTPYPIASFSSRGPTPCTPAVPDNIKPEISAPGVNVYSSVPGGGYNGSYSGTSMAGPHVAGVVALMREACPNCDHISIKDAIMTTAIDAGYGTPGQDNTFGYGMINAYDAVIAVSNLGRVAGTVRETGSGTPIQGVDVAVIGGSQQATTNVSGGYILPLAAGTYDLAFSKFGYASDSAFGIVIIEGDTINQDMLLTAVPIDTLIGEDFETGAADWTHNTPGGQWVDQWHISTERFVSGGHSYKCGDTGTGTYASLLDSRLDSPTLTSLPADAHMEFSLQVESELSAAFPDSAYDGLVLEISTNGGAFGPLTAAPGYNKTFRYTAGGGNPVSGPMAGRPCYAGTLNTWVVYSVNLGGYAGMDVQFRWRFGSDAGSNQEGAYLDDVLVIAPGTIVPPTAVSGLVIYRVADDIHLSWDADGNAHYRIYSSPTEDFGVATSEGSSDVNTFVVPGGLASDMKFFYVVGWDGN